MGLGLLTKASIIPSRTALPPLHAPRAPEAEGG